MDSNSKTVILIGSLDENFGKAICAKLAPFSKSYPMKVLGMPTWDAVRISMLRLIRIWKFIIPHPFYINPADSLVDIDPAKL